MTREATRSRTVAGRLRGPALASGRSLRESLGDIGPLRAARGSPGRTVIVLVALVGLVLVVSEGLHDVAQTGLNGLALGSIYALAALGLTLVYGILKLVNIAHADFLTFGAYSAFVFNVTLGLPLALAILLAITSTAALGLFFERAMWGPMRARKAGLLQLVLMSIGLAFVIRYGIQYVFGTELRQLDVDRTSTVRLLGLSIGKRELLAIAIGFAVLSGIGVLLKFTLLGKRMRAVSDDFDLAEIAGIDTSRVVQYTWVLAGGSAGLAGVLAGTVIDVRPELGFTLLLAIFAAVVLGGVGDAFGALAGGILLGVMIEWSTLVIDFRYKTAVGFAVLILTLLVRPQGIFGRARTV